MNIRLKCFLEEVVRPLAVVMVGVVILVLLMLFHWESKLAYLGGMLLVALGMTWLFQVVYDYLRREIERQKLKRRRIN